MASIEFWTNEGFKIPATSGLGFYGAAGFGASVRVGEYQDRTFLTNSTGSTQGPEIDNVKFIHRASGFVTGGNLNILNIPNYKATLNIRFLHDSAVQTQNAVVHIDNRVDKTKPASGVTCRVAEIIHPETSQAIVGSGDTAWIGASGSVGTIPLIDSPGTSGIRPNGASTTSKQHDWYLAVSASPKSIGSKTNFGLYASLEYL